MGELIWPDFRRKSGGASGDDQRPVFEALHIFGEAAGYGVYIVHDVAAQNGGVFKIVVGQVGSDEADTVANLPATPEGKAEAVRAGLAIMRTLELIDSINNGPPS
jgi:hypothetical protein